MKKYYTPEIELEIISTSDICSISVLSLDGDNGIGESPEISWNSNLWS